MIPFDFLSPVSNDILPTLIQNQELELAGKVNGMTTPLFIYDAPDGFGCLILHALIRIVCNGVNQNVFSAFILPDLPNRIFIEANDLTSVRSILRTISGIGKIPKQLSKIQGISINYFFCNPVRCLHFHPGQIVIIMNPEFHQQIAQIVDIRADKGKILVKTYPHIDYDLLNQNPLLDSQKRLNEMMDHTYHPPMNPFRKDVITTATKSNIVYWNCQVSSLRWDDKDFIGEFQYIFLKCTEIQIKKYVSEEEKAIFEQGMSSFERHNTSFVQWFNGCSPEDNIFSSNETLRIILNTGRPSWAIKPNKKNTKSSQKSASSNHSPHIHQQNQSQNEHELSNREVDNSTQCIDDERISVSASDEFAGVEPGQNRYVSFQEVFRQTNSGESANSSFRGNDDIKETPPPPPSSPDSVFSSETSDIQTISETSDDSDDEVDKEIQSIKNNDFSRTKTISKKSTDFGHHDAIEILSSQSSSGSEEQKENLQEKHKFKKHSISQKSNWNHDESSDDSVYSTQQPSVQNQRHLMKVRKRNNTKSDMKNDIKSLLQKSKDFGKKPPDNKIYFPLEVSSSDDDENPSIKYQPEIDKESILNEQSRMIKDKKIREFYKKKRIQSEYTHESESDLLASDSYSDSF